MIRRHSLVWLDHSRKSDQWEQAAQAWLLAGNPFVLCRTRPMEALSLGFCLPSVSGEKPQRHAVAAHPEAVVKVMRPPLLREMETTHHFFGNEPALFELSKEFDLRVFGSHLWEGVVGSGYVTPDSDLDLVAEVSSLQEADVLASALLTLSAPCLSRLDLELSFAEIGEVHWREWLRPDTSFLVKSVEGVALRSRRWVEENLDRV